MNIICTHCTTSYAIDPATLGTAGRTVRCSRCKEVWLARPEDAIEIAAPAAAMAADGHGGGAADDAAAEWEALAREEGEGSDAPMVDSPSISGDWPVDGDGSPASTETDWPSIARLDMDDVGGPRQNRSSLRKLLPAPRPGAPVQHLLTLAPACT